MCRGGNLSANKKYHLDVKNIIGVDNNKYLIALLKKVQLNELNYEEINYEIYTDVRKNKDNYEDWYVGYVGFIHSFSGKFFNGFLKYVDDKGRVRSKQIYNNLINQRYSLSRVKLFNKDIFEIDYNKFPKNSLLYFDPPYSNTTKYHSEFDSKKFWELVDNLSKYFIILISEFNAPDNYVSIWSKEKISILNSKGSYKKDVEHLFIHKNNLKFVGDVNVK